MCACMREKERGVGRERGRERETILRVILYDVVS